MTAPDLTSASAILAWFEARPPQRFRGADETSSLTKLLLQTPHDERSENYRAISNGLLQCWAVATRAPDRFRRMLDVVEAGTVQLAILSGLGDVQAAKAFGDLCDMVVLQMEAFGQIGHHHSSNQAFIDHDSFQHPDISSAKLQIGCLNFLTSLARAISAALRQLGPCSEVDTPSRSFPSAAEAQSKFTSTTPKEQRLALEDRLSILAHVAVQLAERTLFAATLGREAEEEKNTPPLPGIKPLVKPGASNPENHAGESNSRDASEDASLRQAAQGFLEFCVRTLCQELPLACFTLPSGSRGPPARPVAGGGMAEDGNGGNVAGSPLVAAKRRKLSGEDVGGLSGEGSGGQRGGNPGSGTMWPNVGVRAGVGYPSTVPPSNAAMDRDQPSTGGQVPGLPPLVDGAVASAKRLAQVCLRLYGDQVSGNQGVVGEAVAKVALRQLLLLLRTLSTSWQANGEAESALSQLSSTLDLAAFVRSWLGHGKSLVWQLVAGAAHTAQVTRIMQCASCSLPHGAVLPPFPGSNGGTVGINHDREQGFQRDERKLERAEAKQPEMLATLRRHVALLHLLLHSLYTIFSFLPQSLIEGITQPAGRAVRGDNPSGAKEQDGIDDDVSHTWERGDAGSTGTQGGDRKDKASRKGAVCIAPAVAGVGNGRQDGNVLAPQDGDAVGMGPEGWQGGCMRPAIDPSGCNDLLGSGGRAPGGLRGGGRIADEECSAGNKDILFGAGTHVQEDAAASGMANFVAMITGITGVACMMDGGVSLVSCRTCHMGHSSRRKDVDGELAQPPGRDEAGRLPLPSRGEITADGVKAVADSEALFNAALASVQKLFHLVWALAESFLQHPGVGGRCKATTVTAVGTGGGTMPTILAGLAAPEDDARARLADHTGNGKGGIACLDSRGEWEDSTAARALGRHASHSILQHECVMGSPESVLCLGRLATIQRLFLVASRPVQGPADLLGGSSNPAKSTSLTTTGTTTAAGDAGDGHDGSGHYNDDSGQTSLLLLRGECVRQLDWLLDATASSASVTMSPAFRSLLLAQASTLFADSCYVTLALAAATMSAGGAGNEPKDLRDAGGAPGQPPPPQPLLLPPQAKAMASHAWRLAVRVLTAVLPAGGDMPWPATRGQPPGACERKKESTGIRPQDSGHFLAVLSAALRLLARSMEALSAPTGPGGQCGDFPSTNGAKVSPTVSSSSDQVSSAALCSQFFDIVARISRFLEPTHGDGDSTTSAVPGRAAGIESMASAQVPVRRNAGHAEPLSSMLGTAREAVPQANGGPPRHMGAASTGSRAVVVLPAWPVVSPLVAALAELVAAAGHLGHDDDDDQREGNHGGQNNTHSGDDFVQSNRGGRGGPIACADGSRVSQEGPCAVASIEAAVASLLALVIRPWLPAGPPTRAAAGRAEQDREGPCAIGQTGGGATQRPVDLPRPSSFPVMNHGFASQQAVAAPTTHEEDQNLAVPAAVPVAPSPWPLVHLSLARFLSYASVAASEGFARLIPRGWRANSVLRLAAERQKREREGGSSGGTGHGGAFTRDTGPSVHKTGLSPCYDEDEGVGHEEDSALFCQELLRFSKGEQQGDDHQAGDGADSFAWVKPCLTREDEVYALSRDSSAVACHHQACIRACLLDRATEGLQTVQAGMGLLRAVCRQMGMEDVQAHLLPAAAAENPGGGENPLGTVTTSPQDRSSLLLEWKMRDMQEQLGRAWDEALACLKD
eukprot:jgi/Mesvir1/25497/Mv01755-RA.4